MTLGTFWFTLAVLLHRLVHRARVGVGLRQLASNQSEEALRRALQRRVVADAVADRFEAVRRSKRTQGVAAAVARNGELGGRDEEALARVYGLVGSAVQLMLALGFLGTVWGISRSLFGSFALLADGSVEHLRAGLQGFTVGLSTALDTSVLGLLCGLVTTVLMSAVEWGETNGLQRLTALVAERLGLGEGREAQPTVAATVEAELRKVVATLARDAQHAMIDIVGRAAGVYEARLAEAFQRQLTHLDERERRLFETAAGALGREMATAIRALEEHSRRVRLLLSDRLQQIADDLHRTPEVSIRYPHGNGNRPVPAPHDAAVPE
jgi:biopolymer transport protein ExbB/TolQ